MTEGSAPAPSEKAAQWFADPVAQEIALGAGLPALGSNVVASQYSMKNSLQFIADTTDVVLSKTDAEESFAPLYARLLGLHDKLSPAVDAPVIPLPKRERPAAAAARPPRADVEQVLRAA